MVTQKITFKASKNMAIDPTSQAGRKFSMVQLRSTHYWQRLACVDGLVKALLTNAPWMAKSFFLLYKLNMVKTKRKKQPRQWTVYILRCSDGSFYTGVTNNIEKRLICHNRGRASKYTRSRTPVTLLARSCKMNKSEALRLEMNIKKTPKAEKLAYLESSAPANRIPSSELPGL